MNPNDPTTVPHDVVSRVLDSLASTDDASSGQAASEGLRRLWESWNALSDAEREELKARSLAESGAQAAPAPARVRATRKRATASVKKKIRKAATPRRTPSSPARSAAKEAPAVRADRGLSEKRRKDKADEKKNKKKERKKDKKKKKGRKKRRK